MTTSADWWPTRGSGPAARVVRDGFAHLPGDRQSAIAGALVALGTAVGPVPATAVGFAAASLGDPRLDDSTVEEPDEPAPGGSAVPDAEPGPEVETVPAVGPTPGVEAVPDAEPAPGVEAVAAARDDSDRTRLWAATLASGLVHLLPDRAAFRAAAADLRTGDPEPMLDLLAAYRTDDDRREALAGLAADGPVRLADAPLCDLLGARALDRALAPVLDLRDLLADRAFHRLSLAVLAGRAGEPSATARLAGRLPAQLSAVRDAGDSLTARLRPRTDGPDGFVRLTPLYLDEPPGHDPETYWRTGFGLRSVARGDALVREAAVEGLHDRLRDGANRLVVGRPGSGKSTICKTVAWRWYRDGHGPVWYREGGTDLDSTDDLVSAVRRADGHSLVVVEDAVRPANHAVFDALSTLGDRADVSFLLDARRTELDQLEAGYPRVPEATVRNIQQVRGRHLGTFEVPGVDRETCRRLVEQYESVTGSAPVESAGEIYDRVASPGVGDEMLHLAYELVGSPTDGESGLERTVAEAYVRHRDADALPAATGKVALAVNVLNAANLPVHPDLLDTLDADGSAIDDALAALEGDLLFGVDAGGTLQAPHEVWSALYVRQLVDREPGWVARERFEFVVNALFALAHPDRRPDTTVGRTARSARDGGRSTGPDEERLVGPPDERPSYLGVVTPVAKLVERIADLGTRWPVLAPLYGTAERSGLTLPDRCSTMTRVRFVAARGDMYRDSGEFDAALAEYRHADDLVTADGSVDGRLVRKHRVRHHNRVGDVHRQRGRLDDAATHYEQALAAARQLRFRTGEARSLSNLGVVARMRGELDRAENYYEEALAIYRDVGSRHDGARLLKSLGNISWETGAYPRAERYYEEALAIYRDVGSRKGQAVILNNLGVLAKRTGDLAAAETYHRRSMQLKAEVGDVAGQSRSRNNLGLVYQELGEFGTAEAHFEESLALKREMDDRLGQAKCLMNLGVTAEKRGDLEDAEDYHRRSLELYREVGHRDGEAGSLNNLGVIARLDGRLDEAERYSRRGLATFRDIGDRHGQAECLKVLGRVAADRGDLEAALERFERAADLFVETGSAAAVGAMERVIDAADELGREERSTDWCETALQFTETAGLDDAHREFRQRCSGD